MNCHDTGEKALFCVIRMALPEARGSLDVKSIIDCTSASTDGRSSSSCTADGKNFKMLH